MRVRVVINRRSGTVLEHGAEALADIVDAAFSEAGHEVTVALLEPDELRGALSEAFQEKPDAMISGGGDGTIRTAAPMAIEHGVALGILPFGTMNRLARDLGIPLDPEAAARALAGAEPHPIDVAYVNDQMFLNNSIIGLPPDVNETRQELRGKPFGTRVAGYFGMLAAILRRRRRLAVAIDDGGRRRALRVMTVAVTNNPYAERPSLLLARDRIDRGKLGLYISKHHSALRFIWAMTWAVAGRWPRDEAFEQREVSAVELDAKQSTIKVTNDGEIDRMTPPLRYEIRAGALTVLLPKDTERQSGGG
ncbi:MAG: diacylglycerol kinase family protein [Bauldia litoralis]